MWNLTPPWRREPKKLLATCSKCSMAFGYSESRFPTTPVPTMCPAHAAEHAEAEFKKADFMGWALANRERLEQQRTAEALINRLNMKYSESPLKYNALLDRHRQAIANSRSAQNQGFSTLFGLSGPF